jgi:hypothetical protein
VPVSNYPKVILPQDRDLRHFQKAAHLSDHIFNYLAGATIEFIADDSDAASNLRAARMQWEQIPSGDDFLFRVTLLVGSALKRYPNNKACPPQKVTCSSNAKLSVTKFMVVVKHSVATLVGQLGASLMSSLSSFSSSFRTPQQLFIKTLTGRTIVLVYNSSDTIASIKQMIYEKEHIPLDQQRLFWAGMQLAEGRTLAEYKVTNGCTFHVMQRLCGRDSSDNGDSSES